jgi:very-short-patch-repair endonuclease
VAAKQIRSDSEKRPPLLALVDSQWGVVSRRQLLALGLSEATIKSWLRQRRLRPLYSGVYAYGHAQLRVEGRWMAAVLACSPGAVLFGRSAAACLGLLPYASATIHVVTERKLHRQGLIHPHRARSLDARDITSVQRIPTTTIPRTALDLAATEPTDGVERLLAQADRLQLYDQHALESVIERNPGHHGAGPLAALIAFVPVLTRSELEAMLLTLARDESIDDPIGDHPIHLPRTGPITVDFYFASARVIVEADSWKHHRSRASFEADRLRDLELASLGYRSVRVTARGAEASMALLRRLVTSPPTTATTTPGTGAAPSARRARPPARGSSR